jgi:hypothetical protein
MHTSVQLFFCIYVPCLTESFFTRTQRRFEFVQIDCELFYPKKFIRDAQRFCFINHQA